MSLRRRPARLSGTLLALALAASACGGSEPEAAPAAGSGESAGKIVVAATVAPITSIAANIGGERVELTGIVPEGTNSHTYEPPPQISRVLSRADVVLVNGLKLEDPTLELAEENKKDDALVVALGDAVLPESEYLYDFSFPEEDGKPNPHLWTDPTFGIRYAGVIRDTFVQRDPEGKAYYDANHDRFVAKAQALSDALEADQASIPEGKKLLLTYHDAYAYFARTYGWEVVGAVQPSNFEDPQPKEIARLVDQVRAREVPVVFGSEVFPSKVLEQIADETGARYEDTLRDDDLPGAPGEPEHSWLGLMRYDYVTMIQGLGGTTPQLEALDVTDVVTDTADYPQ